MKFPSTLSHICLSAAIFMVAGCTLKTNSWPEIEIGPLPPNESLALWRTDVETALAQAKTDNSPVIIYWGALWCPPCNYFKSQILEHSSFETDTKDWTKIYIDGDSDGAQGWGEQFSVVNYPTVLLINKHGKEVQRFYEVLNYEEFKERLNTSRDSVQDMGELIQKALTGEATEDEWAIVAAGAREHYQTQDLYDEALLTKLLPIHKRCPRLDTVHCDALGYAMITAALESSMHSEIAIAALKDVRWLSLWQKLVTTPELALSFANHFQYIPGSLVSRLQLFEEQTDISQTLPPLVATFSQLFGDTSLTSAQRHNAGLAFYQLSRALFPDKDFKDAWFEAWFTLLDKSGSKAERRLIFPTIAKMLVKANRSKELSSIIESRFQNDSSAWYQLFRAARSAAKGEDYPAAISLMKESWKVSVGRSTVLQIVSRSAAIVAEFPAPFRCQNMRDIHRRWQSLVEPYKGSLRNRDKLAKETIEVAISNSECEF